LSYIHLIASRRNVRLLELVHGDLFRTHITRRKFQSRPVVTAGPEGCSLEDEQEQEN